MHVIQVTPLIKGTKLESLSYYSSIPYEIGTFLSVPIRNKKQLAIVTNVRPVSESKANLRSASYSLKKLANQPKAPVISEHLRSAVKVLHEKYPATEGALLYNLLAPDIRNGSREYLDVPAKQHQEETTPSVLNARIDERFLHYQSHVRGTFARRGSVLLIVPTSADIPYAAKELSHGIEDRLVVISAAETKKKREAAFKKLEDTSTPKLIITTPSFAYIEREDLHTVIVEQSASSHYVMRTRPYLDHRDALRALAKVAGRSLLLGDTLVRTEDEVRRRKDMYLTYGEEVKRIVFPAPLTIINQKDKPGNDIPFQLFSPTLLKNVALTLEGNGHVFLYAARRGLAPVVACIDCGYIFRCPDSNTPYSLVRTEKNGDEERWFISSTSGKRVRAADVCPYCGSWRLRERGIGIQQVYDEWKEKMPDSEVLLLDTTVASTPARVKKIAEEFYKKKAAVLVGTQIALPYLSQGVDMSAVISHDATRATPTWRADESFMRLLLKLREMSEKEVLLQTRTEPDALLEYATRGAIEKFYDDEIGLRQLLRYPPFCTFILLTWVGGAATVKATEEKISDIISHPEAQFYSNPLSTSEKIQRHCLIRIQDDEVELLHKTIAKIRSLPPFVKVEVNPERIV